VLTPLPPRLDAKRALIVPDADTISERAVKADFALAICADGQVRDRLHGFGIHTLPQVLRQRRLESSDAGGDDLRQGRVKIGGQADIMLRMSQFLVEVNQVDGCHRESLTLAGN
jgi:hypothetical protein